MALNDADKHRTATRPGSMGRYDPRNSGTGYWPYLIGALVIVAVLYTAFGDSMSDRTTLPNGTAPQTTTTPAPTAPATK